MPIEALLFMISEELRDYWMKEFMDPYIIIIEGQA